MNMLPPTSEKLPRHVEGVLQRHQLMDKFNARPDAVRARYLREIRTAPRDLRDLRIDRMISELNADTIYGTMAYNAAQ